MNPRDIWLIARFELARHVRSRHAIFAGVLLILFCGVSAYQLANFADELAAVGDQLGPGLDFAMNWVQNTTGLPAVGVTRLLDVHPPVLVLLFGMVLTIMPILALMLAYDQTATDIETRHVRYLLFRSTREAIYLGKSLGALLFIGTALALVLLVFGVFLGVKAQALGGVAGIAYLGRIWLTCMVYALPFVGFLGLMSALVGRPRRSFGFTLLAWIGVSALSGIGSIWKESLGSLRYLYPATRDRFSLMLDDFGDVQGQLGYVLLYTAIAGALGLWRFRTRDL